MRNEEKLKKEIEITINRNSAENGSDTPDFILAEYLIGCLKNFDAAVKWREKWYGREPRPTKDIPLSPPSELPIDDRPE